MIRLMVKFNVCKLARQAISGGIVFIPLFYTMDVEPCLPILKYVSAKGFKEILKEACTVFTYNRDVNGYYMMNIDSVSAYEYKEDYYHYCIKEGHPPHECMYRNSNIKLDWRNFKSTIMLLLKQIKIDSKEHANHKSREDLTLGQLALI